MCIQKKKYFFGNTLCEIIHVRICPNIRTRPRHKNALKTVRFLLKPARVVLLQQHHSFCSASLCLGINCFSATSPRAGARFPDTAPRASHAALRRRPVRAQAARRTRAGRPPGASSREADTDAAWGMDPATIPGLGRAASPAEKICLYQTRTVYKETPPGRIHGL